MRESRLYLLAVLVPVLAAILLATSVSANSGAQSTAAPASAKPADSATPIACTSNAQCPIANDYCAKAPKETAAARAPARPGRRPARTSSNRSAAATASPIRTPALPPPPASTSRTKACACEPNPRSADARRVPGGDRHRDGVSPAQALVWNVGTYRLDAKGDLQMVDP
jgi:hypothetical protein